MVNHNVLTNIPMTALRIMPIYRPPMARYRRGLGCFRIQPVAPSSGLSNPPLIPSVIMNEIAADSMIRTGKSCITSGNVSNASCVHPYTMIKDVHASSYEFRRVAFEMVRENEGD